MHVIDHSLARPSPAAAALVSGSPGAGWKPLKACIATRNTAGFSHGNTTTTRSANRNSISTVRVGEKLALLGAAIERSPARPCAPSTEPWAVCGQVGSMPTLLPSV